MKNTIAADQKVSMREKIGYSLGDGSANLIFQMIMMFQMFFYTDVFGIKAGLGVGGAILGSIIDSFGYVASTAQTESALHGIRLTSSIIPAAGFLVGVIALCFYPISKNSTNLSRQSLYKEE